MPLSGSACRGPCVPAVLPSVREASTRVAPTIDLLPADITGTDVLNEVEAGAVVRRELSFMPGPIFHNLVLADEIDPTEAPKAPSLARAEWEHINRVLSDCGGNISEAARRLGIHRRSLQRKLQKYPPLS